jgi:tRNA (guanosine-2'-O-)-methyltransferase
MNEYEKALEAFLEPMVNENRLKLIERILEERTRYITVVLEDIYQPHNASAVLRTCDCFGIQDVHIIENRNEYRLNPEVELGAAQWLTLFRYNKKQNNTPEAIGALKKEGYRIVAATPHRDDTLLQDFDLSRGRAAIMFGTEMRGLSEEALALADEHVRIPMSGFTESFNISVSAAIILYVLNAGLRNPELSWKLSREEQREIRLQWIKNSVKNSGKIERVFKKQFGQ